jgi:hypothetical protein
MSSEREIAAPTQGVLQKNRRWLQALEQALAVLPAEAQAGLMSGPGRACAEDVWTLCQACLGRPLENLADLMAGWNLLRQRLGLTDQWEPARGGWHGVFGECGCPLVRSGLTALTPARCHCTQAMMEAIFARAAGRPVRVKLVRTIARGDDVCEFLVEVNPS